MTDTTEAPDFEAMAAETFRLPDPSTYAVALARRGYLAGMEAAAKIAGGCFAAEQACELIRAAAKEMKP